jgi:glycosyltransferase involved in cell wall biosynthesis
MGHEVIISSYWGLSGAPTLWEGITVLPGFGASYCSVSLAQHARVVEPDLVITLGDVWVYDPNLLRSLPMAHWLPSDCRPMSTADQVEVSAAGAKLIAMSRFGFDRFTDAGYDPVYCPHGIDTEVFKPAADRAGLREAFGFGDEFVIGINAANNDAIRKAIPEMLLGFAKFHSKYPDSMIALHSGVHQDGGQDLEALAEHLGISDRMLVVDQYRLNCGLISPADMATWTQALDVLSACTFGEGFGLPLIEAQACGVPVITTGASAMTELNPYGISVGGEPFWNGVHRGWWVRPSVTQIARAYEKAYLSRGKVNRKRLRKFALGYDIHHVAETYMKPALEVLCGGRDAVGDGGSVH